jgi:hypothetical protein
MLVVVSKMVVAAALRMKRKGLYWIRKLHVLKKRSIHPHMRKTRRIGCEMNWITYMKGG